MWNKWEERFKSLGAKRVHFQTSMKGGSVAGTTITGAKCLLFFKTEEPSDVVEADKNINLEAIIDKTLCSDRLLVKVLKQMDFAYRIHEPKSEKLSVSWGTKVGWPILEISPDALPESKGRDKHRPVIIMSRVFAMEKHRTRGKAEHRQT